MVRVDFIIMCFVQFFVYVWQCFKTVPQDRNLTAGGLLYGFLQMHLRYCLLQNAFSLNFKMKQGIKKGAAASPHKQTECWSLLPCATDNLASNCPDIFSKPVKRFDFFFFVGIKYYSGKDIMKEMLNFSEARYQHIASDCKV